MMKNTWTAVKIAGIMVSVSALTAATVIGTSALKSYQNEKSADTTEFASQENDLTIDEVDDSTAAVPLADESTTGGTEENNPADDAAPQTEDNAAQSDDADVTVIEAEVAANAYPSITVEVNKPVRINFKVTAENLNACNNEILIPEWNITKKLSAGNNYVEFTPTKTGTFNYSCWMNMIFGTITVAEQGSDDVGAAAPDTSAAAGMNGTCPYMTGNGIGGGAGCCSGTNGQNNRMSGPRTTSGYGNGRGMMF